VKGAARRSARGNATGRIAFGFGVLAITLALAATLGTSGCGLANLGPSPQLTVSSTTVSFGNVALGSQSTQSVTVIDSGATSVVISGASITGSGFTASGGSNVTLTPNQSVTITITFKPAATGNAHGQLSVTSDASNAAIQLTLSGTGMAKPAATSSLTTSSTSLSFGNVTVGTTTPQQVILVDSGTADVTISSVSATGSGFSASGGTNSTLVPNQTAVITVNFDPAAAGSIQGNLAVTSNATNSTLNIPLAGAGLAKAPATSQLSASTTSLSFGNVAVGTPVGQSVTLTNIGTATVTISSISASGGFTASGGANVTLGPNQTVKVTVNFNPAAAGAGQGNLLISSNATNPSLQIGLSGTGVAQAVAHKVMLNWQASASSVLGYFVYRGLSASSLSKLFTSADSLTNYTDGSVANGQTYYYAVTSVDSSDIESTQSSPISVTIPNQ
jgi:Abnormal spindle-like microcephaly-assoc'd, ASPM-SPD-2-Hydin/Protein of unknown function (DUF1573)